MAEAGGFVYDVTDSGSGDVALTIRGGADADGTVIEASVEDMLALLGAATSAVEHVERQRVRERAEAFVRDEPEVARAVAKIIEEEKVLASAAPASVIEAATITGASIRAPKGSGNGLIHIGTVPGLNGSLLLEATDDAVVVRLRRGTTVFDIGRWDAESLELRLSVSGTVEIEQAVKAVRHVRDVRRVRVLLSGGDRVIFHRGGNIRYVADSHPTAQGYTFAEDKINVDGGHSLWWHGVEVPKEAVQAAGAVMRGLYG